MISNRDCIARLRNVDSDEYICMMAHGSSSCDEDRLGQIRATLGERSVGRATSHAEADIRSYTRVTQDGYLSNDESLDDHVSTKDVRPVQRLHFR